MTKHRGSTPFSGSAGFAPSAPGPPLHRRSGAPRVGTGSAVRTLHGARPPLPAPPVPNAAVGAGTGRAGAKPGSDLPSGRGRARREEGSSAPPPTAAPSGARPHGAGRGGAALGGAGRAPLRGDPGRALRRAPCRRPPGLRREPIRGRLPARGAEGTQERRGRRSLPP